MPGFGSGSFGHDTFGHWRWSRYVLFESLPELQRVQDADPEQGNGALEKWAESQRPSYDNLRHKIRKFTDLRDPYLARSQYDEIYTLRLGRQVLPRMPIEQRGVDGIVNSFFEFTALKARFTEADEGKDLTISRSSVASNNRTVRISRFVSTHAVLTDPPLAVDAGADRWELRASATQATDEITVEVKEGDASVLVPGHILTDGAAQYEIIGRRLFARTEDRSHLTEREGSDGTIDNLGRFVAPSFAADAEDVGKYLFIQGIEPEDPKRPITGYVSATTVTLGGPTVLAENTGPLFWALLPIPEIDLAAKVAPKGVVEQYGTDLAITAPATMSAPSMQLTASDVGKYITVYGSASAANNHSFLITAVGSSISATVDPGIYTLVNASSLTWEIRSATEVGDLTQVTVSAPSLLTYLARDFGIEVDTQENENRQRSWVRNVTQWIDKKGTQKSYEILAAISGYQATVSHLYRISLDMAATLPESAWVRLLEEGTGRSGTAGSLTLPGFDGLFSDPAAAFVGGDEGKIVRIAGSGSGNDGMYTIETYVDAQTVVLRPADTTSVVFPDANNGALTWDLLRLYTSVVPKRPLFDDINADLMAEIASFGIQAVAGASLVDGETFVIDDGVNTPTTFEFNSGGGVGGGNVAVAFTGGDSAATVAASIVAAINGVGGTLAVSAYVRTGGTAVSLQRDDDDNPLIAVTEAVANAGFVVASEVKFFTVDHLCTEEGMSTAVQVYGISVSSVLFTHTVDVICSAAYPDGPLAAQIVGNWYFVDALGATHFLDSAPAANGTDGVSGLPKYKFVVTATTAPATSRVVAGRLDYLCPEVLSCDFCGSNKVHIHLVEGDILDDTGVALERALDRCVERLQQVTPAHVELVITSVVTTTAEAEGLATATVVGTTV